MKWLPTAPPSERAFTPSLCLCEIQDRYKIAYSGVGGRPEIACKLSKEWSALAADFRTFELSI